MPTWLAEPQPPTAMKHLQLEPVLPDRRA
jgi:hypothetical protein